MPEVVVPESWMEHSLGCLHFRLPPDLLPQVSATLTSRQITDSPLDPRYVDFCNENIHVVIDQNLYDSQEFLQLASRMHPARKKISTMNELRLVSCGEAADDFSWSMSRKEAAWHTFILSLRLSMIRIDTERTESYTGRNWEGTLLFVKNIDKYSRKKDILQFLCECNSCPVQGIINFIPEDEGKNFDADIARRIIRSLEIHCTGCPPCQRSLPESEKDDTRNEDEKEN